MSNNLFVFSGGGCRMMEAATGMMMAMEDLGIEASHYRGASAGGIMSALRASGLSAYKIKEILATNPSDELFKMSWRLWIPGVECDYVYSCDKLNDLIDKYIIESKTIESVEVSLTRREDALSVISPGYKWAIKATKAMPEILPPEKDNNGIEWVDGGVLNNVPVPSIASASKWDHIYIMLCNDSLGGSLTTGLKSQRCIEWMLKTMDREFNDVKQDWPNLPNVTILQPPIYDSEILSWSNGFGLIDHAYQYAHRALTDKTFALSSIRMHRDIFSYRAISKE